MPKKRGIAALTAQQVEERRRKFVFEKPPSPSTDKATNMANALQWRSWGWSMIDAYTKAGVSKKSFKRYLSYLKLRHYMLQNASFFKLHSCFLGRLLMFRKEAMVLT